MTAGRPPASSGNTESGLAGVRDRIEALDASLMDLIETRVALAQEAGSLKQQQGQKPRDFIVERTVVERFRRGFAERGLDPATGEQLATELFTETLRAQETAARTDTAERPGRVLIVGGAGRMGRWLADYFDTIGHEVLIHDRAGEVAGYPSAERLSTAARAVDAVVVSVPPDAVASVLTELEGVDTPVVEIASLKSPFVDTIERLAKHQPVASVHPMWGPDTRVLSDKYLLVCDGGCPEATEVARTLFEPSMATLVEIPLVAHDEAMAFTQVLPQAISLLFAEVLSRASFTLEELDERGGGSFTRQAAVTEEIAHRDPDLYQQIQALNDHAPDLYDHLEAALTRLRHDRADPAAFEDAMRRYRHYFADSLEGRHP